MSEWERRRYIPKAGEPALPPQLSEMSEKSTEDIMKELNSLPFFMTELDEGDGAEQNDGLEALKSLAYEGEPHEVANNFRNQGNDCYKAKKFKDAIQFYNKGLAVECDSQEVNIALYLNRAACNLEIKNYRRCIEDCKNVLIFDNKNIKACYRSAKAYMKLGKLDEGKQVLSYARTIDPANKDFDALAKEIKLIEDKLRSKEEERKKKREEELTVQALLTQAIQLRNIVSITSSNPVELLKDASIHLEDKFDLESQLIFPAMILYPTLDEFDFLAEVGELSTVQEILDVVMDRPVSWFEDSAHKEFLPKKLEVYMETLGGGLIKIGKKAPINDALMSQKVKVPLFDNALRFYVVPKNNSMSWLSTWDKTVALSKRLTT